MADWSAASDVSVTRLNVMLHASYSMRLWPILIMYSCPLSVQLSVQSQIRFSCLMPNVTMAAV